jgi:hypothetical protein
VCVQQQQKSLIASLSTTGSLQQTQISRLHEIEIIILQNKIKINKKTRTICSL